MAVAQISAPHRHLKVTGHAPAFGYEPCEDVGCQVGSDGIASSCGRTACPACGCGGTNVASIQLAEPDAATRMSCTCGHTWAGAAGDQTFS